VVRWHREGFRLYWRWKSRARGGRHLRRILKAYVSYFNEVRTHLSLNKDAPIHRPIQRLGRTILYGRLPCM
jgi:hypothetical protein